MRVAFIDHRDPDYSAAIRALAMAARQRRLVPLLGAGVSVDEPSRLPLAGDLVAPLVDALRGAASLCIRDTNPQRAEVDRALGVVDRARLERLLDVLHETHGRAALEYLSILNSQSWNANHAAVAALADAGLMPRCMTLNFDLLIEEAVAARRAGCVTECPLTDQRFHFGNAPACLHVLKPHGSFAPKHATVDPFDYLSATLSQVGSRPARRNVAAVRRFIRPSCVLLVAGYSDHDWDIFPILARMGCRLHRVIWVQYASEDDVERRAVPVSGTSQLDPLRDRVIGWLSLLPVEATLLVGPLSRLLVDLLDELDIRASHPETATAPAELPDASCFSAGGGPDDLQSMRTAVSLAMLIQQSGAFSELLLRWLRAQPLIGRTPDLAWRVESLIGHTKHTWGQVDEAVQHTRRVIGFKAAAPSRPSPADDLVWLGYEYLCLTKRPNPLRPLLTAGLPLSLCRGLWFLWKGVRAADHRERGRLAALAAYYRADLVHSWGNLLMLFGGSAVRLFRPLFRYVVHLYEEVKKDSELMDGEYYWLRHLEARLLADAHVDRQETEDMLDEIERSYELVQNNVQIGNTSSYRALAAFCLGDGRVQARRRAAVRHLDRAARAWSEAGSGISSGRRRVELFRRFIGQTTLREAVIGFLREQRARPPGAKI